MSYIFPAFPECPVPGCERWSDKPQGGPCRMHRCGGGPAQRRTSDRKPVPTGQRYKLTDEQIKEAKRMRSAFKTQDEIARHFGVDKATLRRYFKRQTN